MNDGQAVVIRYYCSKFVNSMTEHESWLETKIERDFPIVVNVQSKNLNLSQSPQKMTGKKNICDKNQQQLRYYEV